MEGMITKQASVAVSVESSTPIYGRYDYQASLSRSFPESFFQSLYMGRNDYQANTQSQLPRKLQRSQVESNHVKLKQTGQVKSVNSSQTGQITSSQVKAGQCRSNQITLIQTANPHFKSQSNSTSQAITLHPQYTLLSQHVPACPSMYPPKLPHQPIHPYTHP